MLRISATGSTYSKTVGGASCPALNPFIIIALRFYMSRIKNGITRGLLAPEGRQVYRIRDKQITSKPQRGDRCVMRET